MRTLLAFAILAAGVLALDSTAEPPTNPSA